MAKRGRSSVTIDVEVDLDLFDDNDLLDELRRRGVLDEAQVKAVSSRADISVGVEIDAEEIEKAKWRLHLGDRDGAVYHLENGISALRGLAALLGTR